MDIKQKLVKLGLTTGQSEVYFACLDAGESRAQDIVRKVKLPRSTVYLILEELETLGLVTSYDKNKIKHFAPENPQKLIDREKEKTKTAEELFPELSVLFNTTKSKPAVRFYRGLDQIKEMYNSFLSLPQKTQRVFGSEEYWIYADKDWFIDYARRRGESGMQTKIIFEDSPIARESAATRAHGRTIKYLPLKYKNRLMTSDCTIFSDRVAFQNYGKEMVSIVIESKEAASLMELMFDLAWDSIPE